MTKRIGDTPEVNWGHPRGELGTRQIELGTGENEFSPVPNSFSPVPNSPFKKDCIWEVCSPEEKVMKKN